MASVRKRSWQSASHAKTAWVVDYKDQDGTRRLKTFKTKKEAVSYRDDAQHEIKEGTHTPDSASITVAEAGELWITQGQEDGLERSTSRQYRQHLDQHIKPFLGTVKLSQLTAPMVKNFRNRLRQEGRSPVMVKKVVTSLGSLIAEAQESGLVSRNVVRETQRRRRKGQSERHKKRVEIPTKSEIRAFLEKAEGRWRPLIVTAIFTGLRASELRGLTWDDVDFESKVIRVRQRADRWNQIGSPKSEAGRRDVPMAPIVGNTLREWRIACPKGDVDLVFPNGRGGVENLSNIYNRGFVPLQIASGVVDEHGKPKYGLHALRHVAASLFIEQGFLPKRIQAIMGHSSIKMTYDTYGHLFPSPDDDQAAMEQLQARVLG